MSNIEKVKKAWDMGWTTLLESPLDDELFYIVKIYKDDILLCSKNPKKVYAVMIHDAELEQFRIKQYFFVAGLAGDKIPKGQKFRSMKTLDIIESLDGYDKSDLQPYFS